MFGFILRIFTAIVLTGISAYLAYRKPEQPDPGTLDDLGNPRADEGSEIAKVFGTVDIADPYVVQIGDFSTQPIVKTGGRRYGLFGPKERTTVGFRYLLGAHFVLCLGPVDLITRIRVDKRNIFNGAASGGNVAFDLQNLFGASDREGGVQGSVDILMGGPSQGVNDYLQFIATGPVPAFRGVTSVVLRRVYIGNAPSLRPWDFRVSRINDVDPGYNGGVQWYAAKAAIPNGQSSTTDTFNFSLVGGDIPPADRFASNIIAGNYGYVVDTVPSATVQIFPVAPPSGSNIAMDPQEDGTWRWIINVARDDVATDVVEWDATGGVGYDTPEEALAAAQAAGPYTLTGYSRYRIWVNLEFSVFPIPPEAGGLTADVVVSIGADDMNPAHILREILLSPDCGGTGIDADAGDTWEAAADTLFDEGFGLSIAWRGSADRAEFKREIERHIDARSYVDRRTGKWEIKLIRDDYDPETLPVFDRSNVVSWSNINFPEPSSLINQLVVTYRDPGKDEPASLTISNPARIRMNGSQVFQEKVNYPGISRADLAGRVAMRDLITRSYPLVTGEFVTKNLPTDLNIGSAIIVNNPRLGLVDVVARITDIEDGNIREHSARVRFVQDKFAIGDASPIEIEIPIVETLEPEPVAIRQVEEAPYLLMKDRLGEPNAAAVLTADEDSGFLFAAGARPNQISQQALIWRDTGTGYEEIDSLEFVSGARTLGAMDARADRSKVVVQSRDALASVAVGSLAWINGEHVSVTLVEEGDTSDPGDYWEPTATAATGWAVFTLTVKRGSLDTVPAAHDVASPVVFYGPLGTLEDDIQTSTDAVDVKLQPITTRGVLSLADAPEDTVTFASRAIRPYPPGRFKVNGSYEQDTVLDGPTLLEWVDRNRLTDTSAAPVGHDDAGVTGEADVTYLVEAEAFDEGGASISTFISTNVGTDLDYTWDGVTPAAPAGTYRIVFSVASVRDGYESWQRPSISVLFAALGRGIEDGDQERNTEGADDDVRTIEG